MIITLCSVRGSPGVTSWSVLIGAAWPSAERVVLEADSDGGVLGARYGIGVEPGVPALLAAVRRSTDPAQLPLAEVARRLGEGLWVIPQPEAAERAASVWGSLDNAEVLAGVAAGDDRLWVVDAGRMRRSSLAMPFATRSELTVVLTRAGQEDLVQVPERIASLHTAGVPSVGVLLVGRTPYEREELREFFGTGLVWGAHESSDLVAVTGAALSSRRARRSWVWRSATEVVGSMAARLATPVPAVTDTSSDAVPDAVTARGPIVDGASSWNLDSAGGPGVWGDRVDDDWISVGKVGP